MTVKRYEAESDPQDGPCSIWMEESAEGNYVTYSDYQKLVAENAALKDFIATSCYVFAGEEPAWHPAIDHAPESPATNCLSVNESRFLTDVITAAGLLSHGKQDKGLARRIANFCVAKIGSSSPANLRAGVKS